MSIFNQFVGRYILALDGLMDVQGAETRQQYEARIEAVVEELLADAYAGMNMWNAGADRFTDTVRGYLEENNISRKPRVENGVRETNGPPESGQKEITAGYGGDRYAYDYFKSFRDQLEDYEHGLIPKGDTLLVGPTPKVFQNIGMPLLPVTINTTHIDYALNGTKDFDHHLGKALLSQLPKALETPVAIMTSGTKPKSSIVVMLEIRHNGKQVVVSVVVDGFGKQNGSRINSNAITSIYGKDYSISRALYNAIDQENKGQFRLYYLNTSKATALLQGAKVLMPKMPATHNGGYIHSITESGSPVKMRISSVTESQQFKRWCNSNN